MKRGWVGASLLLVVVLGTGAGLATWKIASLEAAAAESANQPEPMESVTAAVASPLEHRRATTSIGTVVALRSITLRNELAGTVDHVALVPGRIVEAGTVLVALDVSVEQAELAALEAEAALAETVLSRMQLASRTRAVSDTEVDRARAERDVAHARIARTKAIIERKTIQAPFRARVGLADVHAGQYLEEGTLLTTLQGVDDAAHVDFAVEQGVAAGLRKGQTVEVFSSGASTPTPARIVAIDARVDPRTRNATVRAMIPSQDGEPAPGASVRVRVGVGERLEAFAIPVSALRKGPAGDHVFVLEPDENGGTRAHQRMVVSGPVLGDEVLIEDGLSAGEKVAVSGSFKLFEGVLVAVTGGPAADPGAGN
jgi:membrane fusion protein (multidrug efflux system)